MVRSPRLIAAARVLAGLTQQDLALAAGIPTIVLKKLEQGRSDPRHSTVLAVVDALAQHGVRLLTESDRVAWGVYVERGSRAAEATMLRDVASAADEQPDAPEEGGAATKRAGRSGR